MSRLWNLIPRTTSGIKGSTPSHLPPQQFKSSTRPPFFGLPKQEKPHPKSIQQHPEKDREQQVRKGAFAPAISNVIKQYAGSEEQVPQQDPPTCGK